MIGYKDDLWRRNHETITALRIHAGDFDPHYPTSIAYTPLPRAALETFLRQRGMLDSKPHFVHTGLLNSGTLLDSRSALGWFGDCGGRAGSNLVFQWHRMQGDLGSRVLRGRRLGATARCLRRSLAHDHSSVLPRSCFRWSLPCAAPSCSVP